MVDQPGPMRKV